MLKNKKTLFIIIGLLIGIVVIIKLKSGQIPQPQYQTAKAERSTIVATISVSGQVSTANSAQVTTKASGIIKNIYVENGQDVIVGQKIADIELDLEGQQRSVQAYSSYQSAKDDLYSLQSSMLTKWKTYMDIAESGTYENSDGSPKTDTRQLPQYVSTNDDWLSTEAKYKNQQNIITSAWLSYQQSSPTIYAPISGKVTGFGLQIGSVITAQSNSSGGSTAQKIASIKTQATPTVTVNLTEIDVPKVKNGHKTILTLDAFPGKTFAGKVISVDTVGAVSSGVTTYPAVIKLDINSEDIYTNMSVQAKIITDSKSDALAVPVSAITTQNGRSTVRVMKNGKPQVVPVKTGLVSQTVIEIVSGLSEGETIVTSLAATTASRDQTTGSVFGGGARIFGR